MAPLPRVNKEDKVTLRLRQKQSLPSSISEEDNRHYYLEVEDYDWVKAADNWVGAETLFHKMRERALTEAVKVWGKSDGKVLDAGCGTGLILRYLKPGAVGLDLNIRHLEKAEGYAPEAELVKADMEKLPFKGGVFGMVISGSMLGQLLSPEVGVKELVRVLNPGGRLIMLVSSKCWLWKLRWLSRGPREPVYRLFSREELVNLLLKAGVKVKEVKRAAWGMEWLVVGEKV
jgi:ubiquinone/menaquinone biosynthesis C-methylase UbiE